MQPYFIWKNTDSREMGLWVSQYPNRMRATERVTTFTVPGRAGQLTLAEGEAVYDPLNLQMRVQTVSSNDFDRLSDWLQGDGLLVLGRQPDKAYAARITQQVEFSRVSNDISEATLQFACDPFKRSFPKDIPILLTASGTVVNPANVPSKPIITITGSGNITLVIGEKSMALTGVDTEVTIDCDAQMVLDKDGENALDSTSGDFFTLAVGVNSVTWTGSVTSVEIVPEWRWL